MARKKIYSYAAAYSLLHDSEGRKSPKSGEEGHTILQHVGGTEAQVGRRLGGSLNTSSASPLIIKPDGNMADKKETIDVYTSAGLYPSKKKAGDAFDEMYVAPKTTAGAFLDQQQAARALEFALNSAKGQAALGALDAGSKREFFTVDVSAWTIAGRADAKKMYYATRATVVNGVDNMSDLTHLTDFTSVTVFIDAMKPDGVHLQTLYPVK